MSIKNMVVIAKIISLSATLAFTSFPALASTPPTIHDEYSMECVESGLAWLKPWRVSLTYKGIEIYKSESQLIGFNGYLTANGEKSLDIIRACGYNTYGWKRDLISDKNSIIVIIR